MRGSLKADEAIHNTDSNKVDSSSLDSMDCHDFANAKSRNDDKAESIKESDSKILDEKLAFSSDCARSYLEGNDKAQSCRIADLSLKAESPQQEIILDFFAGSGTTCHAVMELNREDGGNRKCILVTNNEITSLNPNGIAKDVTTKRLKRIMSGSCYDGGTNFKWREKNTPYGDGLEVLEIESISDTDLNIFDKIDEKLYGKDFTHSKQEKIKWVCENFEATCKSLESSPLWVGAGFRVQNNKHLESSENVDFSSLDSMDCHATASAVSRNDKKLDCHEKSSDKSYNDKKLDSTKKGE